MPEGVAGSTAGGERAEPGAQEAGANAVEFTAVFVWGRLCLHLSARGSVGYVYRDPPAYTASSVPLLFPSISRSSSSYYAAGHGQSKRGQEERNELRDSE